MLPTEDNTPTWLLALAVILVVASVWFTSAYGQEAEPPKNTITALVGYGPDGVQITNGGHTVEPFMAPLVGLELTHRMSPVWSWSVETMTGATTQSRTFIGAAGLGWSF